MATRSAIGIQKADGSIQGVYCHWDGYPEHNGQILASHYDREKLLQLIALGNLSTLSKEIGHEQDFDKRSTQKDDWCLFYGRDRGESDVGYREYNDFAEYVDAGEEYMYFFNGTDWIVNDHGELDDNGFPIFEYVEMKINPKDLEEMGWEAEEK